MRDSRLLLASIVALAVLFSGSQSVLADTTRISIGTAGTGGGFYAYGGAVASVVSKYVPDLSVTAESTGGSVENLKLLDKHQIELATTSNDVLYQAFYDFEKSKHFKHKVEVRALFNMYSQPTHVVTLSDSGLEKIVDIKGNRVSVGSPGSGTEVKTRAVLEALGITYRDFTPEFLSYSEGAEALQDKTISAEFIGAPLPNSSVESLALTNGIRLISFSDAEANKIIKEYPFLSKSVIPGGTYKGVDTDTKTIAVQTVIICVADLPDDVAYKIVKAVFEHKDELNAIHPAFLETTLTNATPASVPIHPGAIKYYKEKGIYKE